MQEALQLRPLGVGDVIDRTFVLFRARWLQLMLIAAVPQLVFSIVSRLAGLGDPTSFQSLLEALQDPTGEPFVPPGAAESVGSIGFVVLLVGVVVFIVQAAGVVGFAAARYLGRDITVGAAVAQALRASPRLIVAGIIAFVAVVAAIATIVIVFAVGIGIAIATVGPLFGVLIGAALVAALVFVLAYLYVSWLVMPAIVVLEGAGPIAALRRSWGLSRGGRWRIFFLLVLVFVVQFVLSALFSAVFLAAFLAETVVRTVLQEAASIVANTIAAALQWGAVTVLYYDLRVRCEAFDLQLAAEQLPREP